MKVTGVQTYLTHAGLRNYLFLLLTTDSGLTGLGEASLEWQERTVQTLVHEWVEDRILGVDPRDVATVVPALIRDQYQGGATVLTAISGVEIALWDLVAKDAARPLYEVLGGRRRERLPAYANGWYGAARTPEEYAARAREVVARGYRAMKFDPFGTAWKEMSDAAMDRAASIVAAVRAEVGDAVDLMIEVHGRLSAACAVEMGRRLAPYRPRWYEEPVHPNALADLRRVKAQLPFPMAAGERLYVHEEFEQLLAPPPACDVGQMDIAHCGGLHAARRVADLAEAAGLTLAPHCSVGPVALAAAVHFGWATPSVVFQENFAEYDVPWRRDLVSGDLSVRGGDFELPSDQPGLGLTLNPVACEAHPYRKNTFPSLWDDRWQKEFTQKDRAS